MLGKMTARPGPQMKLAVTRALVERKDDKGRAMRTTALDAIRKDTYASPELRAIVYAESTPEELLKQGRDPVVGPLAYKALLRAKRHAEATDWLVGQFDRMSPETAVDVLAAWLANPPPASATAITRAGHKGLGLRLCPRPGPRPSLSSGGGWSSPKSRPSPGDRTRSRPGTDHAGCSCPARSVAVAATSVLTSNRNGRSPRRRIEITSPLIGRPSTSG